MLSLLDKLKKEPLINFPLIISNNPLSPGLQKAQKLGYNCKVLIDDKHNDNSNKFERKLHNLLVEEDIKVICLAGFMKIISPWMIRKWKGRIINIHPSLLPRYKGLNTHNRALKAKEKIHGCTVHYVTENLDDGEVIDNAIVKIEPNETKETLRKKVLIEEHRLYPEVLRRLVFNRNQFFSS